jgi:iron complex outermembrane receptor protein
MRRSVLMLATVSFLSIATAGSAFAQDVAADEIASDEIIVTAQKRTERLQDVPATIDVVTGDAIQALNLTTFSDIQQLSPGLSLDTTEPGFNSVKLRGVDSNPSSAASSTVDIYFNETPLDAGSAFRAMYDIGQIEVLRGPQGTLRGRTSPSGAITIAAQRPSLTETDGYIQQTLSTQEGINTQGAIGLPIVKDVLAIRVAGLFDRNNGLGGTNLRAGEDERDRTESARASIAFRPSASLDINATYQYLNNRSTFTPLLFTLPGRTTNPILTPADRTGLATQPGTYNYKAHLVTLNADYDLGGASLSYIGGYQKIRTGRLTDIAYGGSIPNYSQPQAFDSNIERITQELRLTSQGQRFWNYLFGAYFEDARATTVLSQRQVLPFGFYAPGLPPLDIAVLNIAVNIPSKTQAYAAFTDHRFRVTDKAQLQVGLRYQETHVERDFVLSLTGPILGPNPIVSSGIPPAQRDVTYRQLTGGASFKYDFSRDLTGYISYGRSYRPGGVIATTAQIDPSLLVFDAEKSNNYEIGLKGTLADRRINFSIAAYQQDFDNYLAYTGSYLSVSTLRDGVVDNNVAFTFNADARVRGVEANISGAVTDRLTIGLSATYNNAVFRNANAPCNDFNGDGIPDTNGAPRVPVGQTVAICRLNGRISDQADWGASFNFDYGVPLAGNREFFVRGLASYVPERTDPFQNVRYDDLLNNSAFIGFRDADGAYEFSFFAKNLANVATLTTRGAAQIDYSVVDTGYVVGTPVKPREFGIIGRARF